MGSTAKKLTGFANRTLGTKVVSTWNRIHDPLQVSLIGRAQRGNLNTTKDVVNSPIANYATGWHQNDGGPDVKLAGGSKMAPLTTLNNGSAAPSGGSNNTVDGAVVMAGGRRVGGGASIAPVIKKEDNPYGQWYQDFAGKQALDKLAQQRSAETSSLISKAMDQTNGINALENAALRRNMLSSINSQNQGALRALRGQQAASGVRGGVASAQMAGQQAQAVQAISAGERGLVEDNIKYKQEALKNASTIVGNQEKAERDMAADKLASAMNLRSQDMQLEAARMQAEAAANSGKRGGKGGGK